MDALSSQNLVILAVDPDGRGMIYRDENNDMWIVSVYGPSRRSLSEGTAALFVDRHGWEKASRAFRSWDDMERYVENHLPALTGVPLSHSVPDLLGDLMEDSLNKLMTAVRDQVSVTQPKGQSHV